MPLSREDILNMRSGMSDLVKSTLSALPPLPPSIEEFTTTPSLPSTTNLEVTIIRPTTTPPVPSLILLFHGGAYITGQKEILLIPGRNFADELNATVILANYRLAPENKFPDAFRDGVEIAEWAAEVFGEEVKGGFVVGGHSAGGHIAAVVGRKLCGIVTAVWFVCPLLFCRESVPESCRGSWGRSHEEEGWGFYRLMEEIWDMWGVDRGDKEWFGSCEEGKCVRAYLQIGGKDCLRDDGFVYDKFLKDRSVDVKMDLLKWQGHGGWSIFTKDDEEHVDELRQTSMDGMKWLLDKS